MVQDPFSVSWVAVRDNNNKKVRENRVYKFPRSLTEIPGFFQVWQIPGLFQVFKIFQVAENPARSDSFH